MSSLKQRIEQDMRAALKAGDKRRLGVLRLMLAAIKQREIDAQKPLDDAQIQGVLEKMIKQRRDALSQYEQAGREDLAEQESFEIQVIQSYLPPPLEAQEVERLIEQAIRESGARSIKEMGKVMALLKPRLQGRADMAQVSAAVKRKLST
ncbi:MAG: GatB/YqeY domain-containing protein [Gammaproteobacteria bacterium]|nr:MAG: GatB/YqeY domain-containing protein [Gammaproteobacteria bacterium]